MSFDPTNKTVAQLLDVHTAVKERFESSQARLFEAQAAYREAKTEMVDFNNRFGRIISLFEDSQ